MKICLIGGIYNKGGARSTYVKITPETTLETGFREAGHQVTTLSHYDEADFGRFDVVHVHHLSYGALRLASDNSATPFVFTPHSTGHLDEGTLSRTRQLSMRYVLSTADAVVSLTEIEATRSRAAFPLDDSILKAIPNGIDVSNYSYRRANRAGHSAPWQILFVGQLIALKRVDVLLRALARLQHDFRLTLAYQNPEMEQELRTLATELGLADRVLFRGETGPRDLATLYQQCDVLVLPSSTEALPSVITEAMLCGLPFVASAVGGIPEQANGFGVVLEDRSAESIAAALANVFDNYQDFQASGEAMSRYARQKYSIDTMVNQHLDLYAQLRGTRPRRLAAKFAVQRGIARLASHFMGTSGPARSAEASATKVA